jgi:hypothetical protein
MTNLYNNTNISHNFPENLDLQFAETEDNYNHETCEVMLVGVSDLLIMTFPILAAANLCCF